MDARDRSHHAKAEAVARELGLDVIDPDACKEITPAEWQAWAQLPATKRMIGFLAEGFVASQEAAEFAETKRVHIRGARRETINQLARDQALQQWAADIYRKLLRGIAGEVNRSG